MQNNYEIMFIFSNQDHIFKASLEKVKEIFKEENVEITNEEDMKIKTLCYEIQKQKEGHYYLFTAKIEGALIRKVSAELKLLDDLLRFMFVRLDNRKLAKKKAS